MRRRLSAAPATRWDGTSAPCRVAHARRPRRRRTVDERSGNGGNPADVHEPKAAQFSSAYCSPLQTHSPTNERGSCDRSWRACWRSPLCAWPFVLRRAPRRPAAGVRSCRVLRHHSSSAHHLQPLPLTRRISRSLTTRKPGPWPPARRIPVSRSRHRRPSTPSPRVT